MGHSTTSPMATAMGGATCRSLRLNGNLRSRQAGVVARRAQRPYRTRAIDDVAYVADVRDVTEIHVLVGPPACPAGATACVTRSGQARAPRAAVTSQDPRLPRLCWRCGGRAGVSAAFARRVEADTHADTVNVSKLCGPSSRVRARPCRSRSTTHPPVERLLRRGEVSAYPAAAPHPILPSNAPPRALGCDARAARSCSVPVAVGLRSMASASKKRSAGLAASTPHRAHRLPLRNIAGVFAAARNSSSRLISCSAFQVRIMAIPTITPRASWPVCSVAACPHASFKKCVSGADFAMR